MKSGIHILIITKNTETAELMKEAVRKDSVRVTASAQFAKACSMVEKHKFELIFSDDAELLDDVFHLWKIAKKKSPKVSLILLPGMELPKGAVHEFAKVMLYKSIIHSQVMSADEFAKKAPEVEEFLESGLVKAYLKDEADELLKKSAISRLEKRYPGITDVKKDTRGFLILGDTDEDKAE